MTEEIDKNPICAAFLTPVMYFGVPEIGWYIIASASLSLFCIAQLLVTSLVVFVVGYVTLFTLYRFDSHAIRLFYGLICLPRGKNQQFWGGDTHAPF